jgi:hypothetical protein
MVEGRVVARGERKERGRKKNKGHHTSTEQAGVVRSRLDATGVGNFPNFGVFEIFRIRLKFINQNFIHLNKQNIYRVIPQFNLLMLHKSQNYINDKLQHL